MKTLYLLRHAHAEEAAPLPLGDHERILSARGEAEAEAVATFLGTRGAFPSFVLSSTALRALQTVRIVYGALLSEPGQRVASQIDRTLYLAPAATLLEHIAETEDNVPCLLVVAHNPGIVELVDTLSGGTLSDHTTGFPTATLAAFQVSAKHWRDLSPKTAKLETVFVV
jgi:phosphohistidine phosphatase